MATKDNQSVSSLTNISNILQDHINSLKNPKNTINLLLEEEPMKYNNKMIDKGINLYLKNVYNDIYQQDIKNLIKSAEIFEENIAKDISGEDKILKERENEINFITKEKIELINKQQEILERIDEFKLQLFSKEMGLKNNINNNQNKKENNNKNDENKKKRYLDLVKKYNNLVNDINKKSKEYKKFKTKNDYYIEDNKLLSKTIQDKVNILSEYECKSPTKPNNFNSDIKTIKTEASEGYTERHIPTQSSNLPTDAGTNRTRFNDGKTQKLFDRLIK